MERIRSPYQGIRNIIRFNWHFYVVALAGITGLLFIGCYFPGDVQISTWILCPLIVLSTIVSLLVSYYVYDRSGLYSFSWLKPFITGKENTLININAGFDETSGILQQLFPSGTETIISEHLPVANDSADLIFLIFAAHEIRNDNERIAFFNELHQKLKADGKIIIVEHLRDLPNFLAYNIGFFHFHSSATWYKTFAAARFTVSRQKKINPFVHVFILERA